MTIRRLGTIRGTSRALPLVAIGLAVGLAGCSTMSSSGRDRIVKAAPHCADQTVQIYFEQFSADVTKEGRAVLAAAARQARPCKVASVDVLGLADSVGGTPDSNLDLSKRRAEAVTAALAAVGLPAGEFKITAVGENGSTTADGRSKPLRRRADIVLHLSPPG
jgi:outer membrane protein OmpA-like peptidoglycan-associated protein